MKGLEFLFCSGLSLSASSNLSNKNSYAESSRLKHAREVFLDILTSTPNTDNNTIDTHINQPQFGLLLQRLDMHHPLQDFESQELIFKSLDQDEDTLLSWDDFRVWYEKDHASSISEQSCSSVLLGRRTIHDFDNTPIPPELLHGAIQCAIAAPNHRLTEPWRFRNIGPQTLQRFIHMDPMILATCLAPSDDSNGDTRQGLAESIKKKLIRWSTIPGWCVVTSKRSQTLDTKDPNEALEIEEDFAATCCAVQNMMLYLWSMGVGTKWVSGPIMKTSAFAELCGIDLSQEKFVGCIWYGYAKRGLSQTPNVPRKKTVEDVLTNLS